jgi:hypothetical protein
VGAALLLRDVWVRPHGAVLPAPRRGGRRFHPERLSPKGLLRLLWPVAEEGGGSTDVIACERPRE